MMYFPTYLMSRAKNDSSIVVLTDKISECINLYRNIHQGDISFISDVNIFGPFPEYLVGIKLALELDPELQDVVRYANKNIVLKALEHDHKTQRVYSAIVCSKLEKLYLKRIINQLEYVSCVNRLNQNVLDLQLSIQCETLPF